MSLMSLLLHAADISHPGKPWRLHKKFADTILEEFFLQGDEEAKLGLPFSPLCDRNTVLIPESQISFIEFIVEPSLSVLSDFVDFFLKSDEGPSLTSNKSSSSQSTSSQQQSNTTNPATSSSSSSSPSTNAFNKIPPTKPQVIKPFQTSSASTNLTRRTESENCIKTEPTTTTTTSSSSTSTTNTNNTSGSSPGGVTKLPLSSRTPSFPLQGNPNNAYGPLRPWNNHLVENKAKWRMIAAGKNKEQPDIYI